MEADDPCIPCKKTFFLEYAGKISFHPVYAPAMARWLIASVRLRHNAFFSSLVIDKHGVTAKEETKLLVDIRSNTPPPPPPNSEFLSSMYNDKIESDLFKPILHSNLLSNSSQNATNSENEHFPSQMTKLAPDYLNLSIPFNQILEVILPTDYEKHCVSFIVNQGHSLPLTLHVYQHENTSLVKEVGEALIRFLTWHENPKSLNASQVVRNVKPEDLDSVRFEVMLLGKVQVKHDIPAELVVDETVEKYHYLQQTAANPNLDGNVSSEEKNSDAQRHSVDHAMSSNDTNFKLDPSTAGPSRWSEVANPKLFQSLKSQNNSAPLMAFDKNKTKIFQIGKQAITLISPDPALRNIEIKLSMINSCQKGVKHKDHFGIFIKEPPTNYPVNLNMFSKEEVRPRCFVFKCSEAIVCKEIMQGIRQARSMCAHGPDPLLGFHSLCRRIRTLSGNYEQKCPETGVDLAAKYIADYFNEIEQKKVKQSIDETCKRFPPKSMYEHLVIIMEMVREIYEERQLAHDSKMKQSAESSSSSSSVSKHFSSLKDKARRSFVNLENLWEKYSSSSVTGAIQSPDSRKHSTDSTFSPGGPRSKSSSISSAQGRGIDSLAVPLQTTLECSSSTEASFRLEDTETSAGARSVQNPSSKIELDNGQSDSRQSQKVTELAPPRITVGSGFNKGKSLSTPYLRRFLHILPDVQESPVEENNPAHMKPVRFSFSKLFRSNPNPSEPVELLDLSCKKQRSKPPGHRKKLDASRPSQNDPASDASSDEEDQGIFFTARGNAHSRHPISKLVVGVDGQPVCKLTQSRTSAFTRVTSKANRAQTDGTPLSKEAAGQLDETTDSESISSDGLSLSSFGGEKPQKKHLTIYQRIFNVISTSKRRRVNDVEQLNLRDYRKPDSKLKTPADIRAAWQHAIKNQLMINKIEKLTKAARSRLPEQPLDSAEETCEEMCEIWTELLQSENQRVDRLVLQAAVRRNVPSKLRGRIWKYLIEQWKLRQTCCPSPACSMKLPNVSYDELLKDLTTHQHAILIDLGRTFPTHPYFCRQLGNGQLALFNLLKAYSLVDKEVGYCQGLSFVAGVLLIHLNSSEVAYEMLCHMMMHMDCRMFYLPDMAALRVAIYQLSRLLFDFHNDLFKHLDANDVSLMLFATPWFLTMFASVLSLDFTARIFDLFFVEGSTALFKTALCLLGYHKENLLKKSGMESIVNYFKAILPQMTPEEVDGVIGEMFALDLGDRLLIYKAEYRVLEEEDVLNVGADEAVEEYIRSMERKCLELHQRVKSVEKSNVDLTDELRAATRQIEGLQQGLSDFARLDDQRKSHFDHLRKENEALRKSHEFDGRRKSREIEVQKKSQMS